MALPFLPGNSFNNAVSVCIGAVNLLKSLILKFVNVHFYFQHSATNSSFSNKTLFREYLGPRKSIDGNETSQKKEI